MMSFFNWILNGARQCLGLLLPVFGKATDFRGFGRLLRWFLHTVLVVLLLFGLGYLNRYLELHRAVTAPFPVLKHVWLPLLFVLIYVMSWLGYWLWQLLGPEADDLVFPDIDHAWRRAKQALVESGIDLTEAPVFLILGRPRGSHAALFEASKLPLVVKETSGVAEAPLQVFANRDAIFVACDGMSLLGWQTAILAGEVDAPPVVAAGSVHDSGSSDPTGVFRTVMQDPKRSKGSSDRGKPLFSPSPTASPPFQATIMARPEELAAAEDASQVRFHLLRNQEETKRMTSRLAHFCRLLLRDRRPYCPINGILLSVPYAASNNDDDASQAAAMCQQDLTTIRASLRMTCPVFALLADWERAPGFTELLQRFPEQRRHQRLGQRFPLMPDLDPREIHNMVEKGMQWFANVLFPALVYEALRLEEPNRDLSSSILANSRLCQLLFEVRERHRRVVRILTRGVLEPLGDSMLLGGCYLAGTGRNAEREQAFVAGVFRRLIDEQNYVSWTPEALAVEQRYTNGTRVGYVSLALLILTFLGLTYLALRD